MINAIALLLALVAVSLIMGAAYIAARATAHRFADVRRRPCQLDTLVLMGSAAIAILMIVKMILA